ncbi:MAG TPA: phage tail tape measure protein, partial [Sphingomonas sp.]
MDRNLRIRMLLEAGDRVSRPLREIAGGSAKAARELRATRDRLRDLDRAQADINGFRELKTGLRSTEAEMTQAQARVAALARQMAATDTPTKKLAAEFARAKRESATLK